MALPVLALKAAVEDQPSATAAPTAVVIPRVEDGAATAQTAQGEEQKTGWWLWGPWWYSPWWWYVWARRRRHA